MPSSQNVSDQKISRCDIAAVMYATSIHGSLCQLRSAGQHGRCQASMYSVPRQ